MIQLRTRCKVADNTGARIVECISVGAKKRRYAQIGDVIMITVKSALPHGMAKKSEVCPALIVRQRKEFGRADGSYIRFSDNAVVLIDKKTKEPRGTRIFGPIPREMKNLGYTKIASLAQEVL